MSRPLDFTIGGYERDPERHLYMKSRVVSDPKFERWYQEKEEKIKEEVRKCFRFAQEPQMGDIYNDRDHEEELTRRRARQIRGMKEAIASMKRYGLKIGEKVQSIEPQQPF